MAKREQAREEAAFARGDVGVDGQATEEQVDVAEVERDKAREQFLRGKTYLGREFLTWLLWRSESGDPLLVVDKAPLTLVFTSKLVLRGIAGEIVEQTIRGAMAPYSPLVRKSLDRGLLVHQARVRLTHGDRTWEATLDAEHFDVRSAKLPELLSEEDDDGLVERLFLADQLSRFVQSLMEAFLQERAAKSWTKTEVPAMKEWMREPPKEKRR